MSGGPLPEPACPVDAADVWRVVRGPGATDPANVPFLERASRECGDPEACIAALASLGAIAQNRRDGAEAGRIFRDVLRSSWGTGWASERVACVNLATLYLDESRLFESLVLSRRGCALSEAAGREVGVALAWRHLATLFLLLEDWPRLSRALDEAERRSECVPEPNRSKVRTNLLHARAALAARRGRFAEALETVERSAAIAPPELLPDVAEARARALLAAGRAAEAAAALADVTPPDEAHRLRTGALAVRCTLATAGAARAREDAVRVVDRLRADPARLSSGVRMGIAEDLGRLLLDGCCSPEDAWRAFDLAGAAALARMTELDRAVRELPALAEISAEDRAMFEEYRERFAEEHRHLVRILASLLREGARDPAVLAAAGLCGPAALCVCAWCNRVRGPERVWIEPGEGLSESPLDVTHGICAECAARVPAGADPS